MILEIMYGQDGSSNYLSERRIPRFIYNPEVCIDFITLQFATCRSALGAGTAHPWQEDEEANSEIGDNELSLEELVMKGERLLKGMKSGKELLVHIILLL